MGHVRAGDEPVDPSALYHSPNWSDAPKRWLRLAFGLLALNGACRGVVLSIV